MSEGSESGVAGGPDQGDDAGGIAAPADVSPFHLRQPDGLTVH